VADAHLARLLLRVFDQLREGLYGASLRTTSTLGVREAMPSGTRSRSAS
jgi:hypothetical protein